MIGSYRQFTMEVPGSFRVVEAEGSHTLTTVLCIAGGAVVILLIILLGKKAAKRRKMRKAAKRDQIAAKDKNNIEGTDTAENAAQADETEENL